MRRPAAALSSAALVALFATSCFRPPKPGDSCSDANTACFDPQTALECLGAIRVGVHCGGPSGCRSGGASVFCDQSDANENDLCLAVGMRQFGEGACAADKKTLLSCRNGRFVKSGDCRGPLGCGHVGRDVACDATLGEPGDACDGPEGACAVDGTKKLVCKGGRLALAATCEGDERCKAKDHAIHCDERRGTPGAACTASAACTADGRTLLECRDDVWVVLAPCRGPDGCTIEGQNIGCDTSLAVAGEGCDGKGAACAADGKTMLQCKSAKWAVERVCPKACEIKKAEHVVTCK
jgi:hypothetical protein